MPRKTHLCEGGWFGLFVFSVFFCHPKGYQLQVPWHQHRAGLVPAGLKHVPISWGDLHPPHHISGSCRMSSQWPEIFLILWRISLFLLNKSPPLPTLFEIKKKTFCQRVLGKLILWVTVSADCRRILRRLQMSKMTHTASLRQTTGVSKPAFVCAPQGNPHPPTDLPRMVLSAFCTVLRIMALLDEAAPPAWPFSPAVPQILL